MTKYVADVWEELHRRIRISSRSLFKKRVWFLIPTARKMTRCEYGLLMGLHMVSGTTTIMWRDD
jgi:hypothetical protein